MRLRNVKNAEAILKEYKGLYIEDPVINKGKWREIFKNDNPIYIEIGMGKGQFITEHAKRFPDINFIGIELESSVLVKAVKKVDRDLNNIAIVNFDASNIKDIFMDNEVNQIFLNFSDPWPKSRHSKRRLTEKNFLNNYQDILVKDGSIKFKTDNRKLFEFSICEFVDKKWKIEDLSLNLHEDQEDIITTEYEDKFTKVGKIIYFIEVKNEKNEVI